MVIGSSFASLRFNDEPSLSPLTLTTLAIARGFGDAT